MPHPDWVGHPGAGLVPALSLIRLWSIYDPATLRVARNEIYARKGRRFRDPWLRDYFANFSWYTPRFDEVELNAFEQRNIALIERAEARFGN
jgi:hypothetical protein